MQNLLSFTALPLILLLTSACQTSPTGDIPNTAEEKFREKRTILIDEIAENYRPIDYSDRGKYSFPKVIARMVKYGPEDEEAAGYIQEYADEKYGFFHFPFVGIARIIEMFPEAPLIRENREAFLERILLHDPGYHYNALTGEGTENHVSMSRTSGYIFAQEGKPYENLAATATEWELLLKQWILAWSKRIYAYGTGEWDSNPYTAYNLVGWLNLYDFAKDSEIREAARAVLDYYAANIALKYTQGILGGPESRGSAEYGPLTRTATEYLGWLWFGPTELCRNDDFFDRNEYIQVIHAATSSYRPPDELLDLALKKVPTPAVYHNTKPNYQLTRKAESREVFLIEDTFTLGTAQTPYGGWNNSAYGVINWKLVIKNNNGLPAVIMGNGGMKSTTRARGRNPFDQFLQYDSVVVQMTRVPSNAEAMEEEIRDIFNGWRANSNRDFEERWGHRHQFHKTHMEDNGRGNLENANLSIIHLPQEMELALMNDWIFTGYADTYLAIKTLSGHAPTIQAGKLIDVAQPDHVAGFIMEATNADAYKSFEDFIEKNLVNNDFTRKEESPLEFTFKTLKGDTLIARYTTTGSWQEMIFDWGSGVQEKRIGFNTNDWKQPVWPSGEGHGRIPELKVNGEKLTENVSTAILSGPSVYLENSILTIMGPGSRYEIDYSGHLPVFSISDGGTPTSKLGQ